MGPRFFLLREIILPAEPGKYLFWIRHDLWPPTAWLPCAGFPAAHIAPHAPQWSSAPRPPAFPFPSRNADAGFSMDIYERSEKGLDK